MAFKCYLSTSGTEPSVRERWDRSFLESSSSIHSRALFSDRVSGHRVSGHRVRMAQPEPLLSWLHGTFQVSRYYCWVCIFHVGLAFLLWPTGWTVDIARVFWLDVLPNLLSSLSDKKKNISINLGIHARNSHLLYTELFRRSCQYSIFNHFKYLSSFSLDVCSWAKHCILPQESSPLVGNRTLGFNFLQYQNLSARV